MSPHRPFFHLFNRFLMPLFCVLLGKLDGFLSAFTTQELPFHIHVNRIHHFAG